MRPFAEGAKGRSVSTAEMESLWREMDGSTRQIRATVMLNLFQHPCLGGGASVAGTNLAE